MVEKGVMTRAEIDARIAKLKASGEALAYGRDGLPKAPLYRVRFEQREMWPDYRGPGTDTVDIEIYEHWLEPA